MKINSSSAFLRVRSGKTWQSKTRRNPVSISHVDGLVDGCDIVEHFKDKFSSLGASQSNEDNNDAANVRSDIYARMHDGISIQDHLLSVEDVDTAVFKHLKRGKASGVDSLS